MNSPTPPPNESPVEIDTVLPLGQPDDSTTIVDGATRAVTEDRVIELFGSGLDFNACLRELYPMRGMEIAEIRPEREFGTASEEDIHTAIAREKLRASGLFPKARFTYIEVVKARYIRDAADIMKHGDWRRMHDAASYLINGDFAVGRTGFVEECTPLFDVYASSTPLGQEEKKQHDVFLELTVKGLRDTLDAMFAPLHAAMHLEEVQAYIDRSRDSIFGRVFGQDVNYPNALDALKRLAESIKKAREKHQGSSPNTYFSVPAMPDGGASAPTLTLSQAEEKAKDLAKILIRTLNQSEQEIDGSNKVTFLEKVVKLLEGTGFTLGDCGFSVEEKKGGFLGRKVVGFKLIEK